MSSSASGSLHPYRDLPGMRRSLQWYRIGALLLAAFGVMLLSRDLVVPPAVLFVLAGVQAMFAWRLPRVGIEVAPAGLTVVSLWRSRHWPWADLHSVLLDWRARRDGPAAALVLVGGGQRHLPDACVVGAGGPKAREVRARFEGALRKHAAAGDVEVRITPPAWERLIPR